MAYTTPEDVRFLCGFSLKEAPDQTLSYYIWKAHIHVQRVVATKRHNAILVSGPENTIFYTYHKHIADIDYNGEVNTSDVQVYKWTDRTKESTKTPVTVTDINPVTGKIELDTDPGGYDVITADYSFYPNEIDFDVLGDAVAYYAGYKFAIKKWVHVPEWMKIGNISTRQAIKPYKHLYHEYQRCLREAITRRWAKGTALAMADPDRVRIDAMVDDEYEELVFA